MPKRVKSKVRTSKEPQKIRKAKAYAGVLPWTVDPKGRLWILLGRESAGPEAGKWSDFGGGVEPKDRSTLAAAWREMGEESMGLLNGSGEDSEKICPSLTFDFGSFHGSLILGVVGDLTPWSKRLTKSQWENLRKIPDLLLKRRRDTPCGVGLADDSLKGHDPTCEKDMARWIRVKDIRQVEASLLLLLEGDSLSERVVPLRKSYGLLLSKALEFLKALQ